MVGSTRKQIQKKRHLKDTCKRGAPKNPAKREPTGSFTKKVGTVSDTTKALQKELKAMTKIFADNQKVLVSMKGMIDTLTSTMENMQKQSKQIDILEDDTQKLYAGLNQIRNQSDIITKINAQTSRLQEEVSKVSKQQKSSPKTETLHQQVEDSMNAIRNNSKMIIKIAQRIDDVRDDLKKVSGKADSLLDVKDEIEHLKVDVDQIYGKTDKLGADSQVIGSLKVELEKLSGKAVSASSLNAELGTIKSSIDAITEKASKIDSLGGVLDGLKQQFDTISSRADAASVGMNALRDMAGKIDTIESKIGALSQRTDSTAFVGEGLKSVQADISSFKQNIFEKTDGIEQKISSFSDALRRQDESAIELHKKSEKLFTEIKSAKNIADKASRDSSYDTMALLRLSEYQSTVRMLAESKYGGAKELSSMAAQTAELVNLFSRISIESGQDIPLPSEVKQWAVSKMLECADRWEIRFSDVYSILVNSIGKDMLKESVRIQQIRDIYGIRGVDDIKDKLDIH